MSLERTGMRCRCKHVVRIVSYCVRSGDQRFELTAYRRRSVDRRVRTKCPDPCQSLQKCLRLGLISNPSMNCLRQALWPALETLCGNNIVCLKARQRGRYQQARGRWFSLSPAIDGGALFQMTDQQLLAQQCTGDDLGVGDRAWSTSHLVIRPLSAPDLTCAKPPAIRRGPALP